MGCVPSTSVVVWGRGVLDTPWEHTPGHTPLLGRHTTPRQTPPPSRQPHLVRHPLGKHPPWQTPLSLDRHLPPHCMLGYTPFDPLYAGIHTPLPIACLDTPHLDRQTPVKHYLPATTFAGSYMVNNLRKSVADIRVKAQGISRHKGIKLAQHHKDPNFHLFCVLKHMQRPISFFDELSISRT